jgi:selenide,water dikinase
MGAKPLYCLNFCSFPKDLEESDAIKIMEGALSKVNEANCNIVGGHTLNEPCLLYGLSVTGIISDKERIFANDKALAKQSIILTKKIGVGILYNAYTRNLLDDNTYHEWIKTMTTLNDKASYIASKYISTMTDVTGFGLLGHGYEVALASNVCLNIKYDKVQLLPQVLDLVEQELFTAGSYANLDYLKDHMNTNCDINKQLLLCDPQTSGGLLLFVDKDKEQLLLDELLENNRDAFVIGETTEYSGKYISVE